MGRPPALKSVRQSFENTVISSANLFGAVEPFCARTYEGIAENPLHPSQARRVVGLAFLAVASAWEEFLESVFVRYLAGAKSPQGYAPHLRVGTAASLQHSYELITGKFGYEPEENVMSWSSPAQVIRRASIFFYQGQPFRSALDQRQDRLQDAVAIRNRVAHLSTRARSEFKRVALHHLGRPGGKLPQGYTAGDLLVERAVRFFPQETTTSSFFIEYLEMYLDLAGRLAP